MRALKKIFKILAVVFLFTSLFSFQVSEKKNKKVKIKGTVTQTFSYCGGARPSNEMLAQLKEPKPFANKKLFIKKGNRNDLNAATVVEVTSDSLGNFSALILPGEYCVVDEFKNSKSNFDDILKKYEKETKNTSAVDVDCLKNWFAIPDLVFTVTKTGLKDLSIVYHHPCSWNSIPCVSYHGPLPQ